MLHFHERDLVRSLIKFVDVHSTKKPKNVSAIDFKEMRNMLLSSTGMHEKSLTSLEEAPFFTGESLFKFFGGENPSLVEFLSFSSAAQNPFKFISSMAQKIENGEFHINDI